MASDPLGEAAAELVARDTDLQARVRDLLNRTLDEAEDLLDNAIPTVKIGLIRSLTPHLVRELRNQIDETDEIRALREEMRDLLAEVRGSEPHLAEVTEFPLLTDEPPGS